MILIDAAEVEVPCPNCQRTVKKTVRWIKANKRFTCVCGTEVRVDSAPVKAAVSKVERHAADLMKKLSK
jgi:hypothetical protein